MDTDVRGNTSFVYGSELEVSVLIVFASDKGYTEGAAEAHKDGVVAAGGNAVLRQAEAATAADLLSCDALIVGSPIHMGAAHWRIKRWIDEVCGPLWAPYSLSGTPFGLFGTGGGFGDSGGGVDMCLASLHSSFAQLGCIHLPFDHRLPGFARGGTTWGPYLRTQDADRRYVPMRTIGLEACVSYGNALARFTQTTKRLSRS